MELLKNSGESDVITLTRKSFSSLSQQEQVLILDRFQCRVCGREWTPDGVGFSLISVPLTSGGVLDRQITVCASCVRSIQSDGTAAERQRLYLRWRIKTWQDRLGDVLTKPEYDMLEGINRRKRKKSMAAVDKTMDMFTEIPYNVVPISRGSSFSAENLVDDIHIGSGIDVSDDEDCEITTSDEAKRLSKPKKPLGPKLQMKIDKYQKREIELKNLPYPNWDVNDLMIYFSKKYRDKYNVTPQSVNFAERKKHCKVCGKLISGEECCPEPEREKKYCKTCGIELSPRSTTDWCNKCIIYHKKNSEPCMCCGTTKGQRIGGACRRCYYRIYARVAKYGKLTDELRVMFAVTNAEAELWATIFKFQKGKKKMGKNPENHLADE